MKIVINKVIETRTELDSYVRTTFGDDASANKDVTLELTAADMQALSLSEDTTVFGVTVKQVDDAPSQ